MKPILLTFDAGASWHKFMRDNKSPNFMQKFVSDNKIEKLETEGTITVNE